MDMDKFREIREDKWVKKLKKENGNDTRDKRIAERKKKSLMKIRNSEKNIPFKEILPAK